MSVQRYAVIWAPVGDGGHEVRIEPSGSGAWCRVGDVAALEAEVARLRAGIEAVDGLIAESRGVDGLHLDGDIALWSDLLRGGYMEEWLLPFSDALIAAEPAPEQPAGGEEPTP